MFHLDSQKNTPKKIVPTENCPTENCPPGKFPPSKITVTKNAPEKIGPKKISPEVTVSSFPSRKNAVFFPVRKRTHTHNNKPLHRRMKSLSGKIQTIQKRNAGEIDLSEV